MGSQNFEKHLSLAEALALVAVSSNASSSVPVYLACGFTPLHLVTFLKAHGRIRFPDASLSIQTGLFDDLLTTIERIPANVSAAILVEWSDLDPRIGFRGASGWSNDVLREIEAEASARLERLEAAITRASNSSVIVISGPTLPLIPLGHTGPTQDAPIELNIRAQLDDFLARLAAKPNIRVVSAQELAIASPPPARMDAAMVLASGYPYTLAHSDAIARTLIEVLFPLEPKKGLITDLDDTLWRGILGEVGVDKIGWTLETHAQLHGIYQQYLAALADRGVLLAIASKNNPELVEKALARTDLFCRAASFFPIEVSWGRKSESVERILRAWNIGPADVVFVDDSPLELAEVAARFPAMTCLAFPRQDPRAIWDLLQTLRKLFAKQKLQAEDLIRSASLRSASKVENAAANTSADEFLASLDASLVLDFNKDAQDTRAFELVNKTNQFNLNGRRWSDYEWRKMLEDPAQFVLTVSYTDRFGPLGRIAVVVGSFKGASLRIRTWVMSCRAFSRRIEHAVLLQLIEFFQPETIELDFSDTERNSPTRQFLEEIVDKDAFAAPITFPPKFVKEKLSVLHHKVSITGLEGMNSRQITASVPR